MKKYILIIAVILLNVFISLSIYAEPININQNHLNSITIETDTVKIVFDSETIPEMKKDDIVNMLLFVNVMLNLPNMSKPLLNEISKKLWPDLSKNSVDKNDGINSVYKSLL